MNQVLLSLLFAMIQVIPGTIQSEALSNVNETHSNDSHCEVTYEPSLPSSISYMDMLYDNTFGSNKIGDHQNNLLSDYDYSSAPYTGTEGTFTPYVSIFPDSEDEADHRRQANAPYDDTFTVFLCKK